jgi:hypothetical protein
MACSAPKASSLTPARVVNPLTLRNSVSSIEFYSADLLLNYRLHPADSIRVAEANVLLARGADHAKLGTLKLEPLHVAGQTYFAPVTPDQPHGRFRVFGQQGQGRLLLDAVDDDTLLVPLGVLASTSPLQAFQVVLRSHIVHAISL